MYTLIIDSDLVKRAVIVILRNQANVVGRKRTEQPTQERRFAGGTAAGDADDKWFYGHNECEFTAKRRLERKTQAADAFIRTIGEVEAFYDFIC